MPAAARPIRRRVITEEVHEGPTRASAFVCEAASCMSAQAHDITAPPRRARRPRPAWATSWSSASAAWACAPPGRSSRSPRPASSSSASRPDAVGADRRGPQGGQADRRARSRRARSSRSRSGSRPRTSAASTPRASTTTSSAAATRPSAGSSSEMTSAEVREEITRSGLRGRGGAGYPTGLKWTTVAKAAGQPEVRHLQRGRGRPRARSWIAACSRATRTGSSRAWRSPPSPSTPPRATSTAAPSTRWRSPACAPPSGRRSGPGCLGAEHRRHRRSASTSRSASAPAPSSAARRRRSSRPSRASAARRGRGRRTRRSAGLWGCPTLINNVETLRQRPDDHPQGRRVVRRRSASARARAPRSSRWPAGS